VVEEETAGLLCKDRASVEADRVSEETDRAAKKAVAASEEARRGGGGRWKGKIKEKGGEEGSSDPSSHGSNGRLFGFIRREKRGFRRR
jgi:hypothetical protein